MAAPTSSSSRDANGKYIPDRALEGIPEVHKLLSTFLSGQMVEAEQECKAADPKFETLCYSLGWGMINALKGMMSFEDEDLSAAIQDVKHAGVIANSHRRPTPPITSRLAGLVIGGSTSGVGWYKGMTAVQLQGELVYAEHLLLKAVLGIVYSGDWLQFIKEALNLRSATITYRHLADFIQTADTAAGGFDTAIDQDFRSGVSLGVGTNSLVLSLLPSRVTTIVSLFGYRGDRAEALSILSSVGGWTAASDEPSVGIEEEGLRRPAVDMTLLLFHLVLSNITHQGVDLNMAGKILRWNLKRYPEGVFFLFAEGRLSVCQSRPDKAIEIYSKAIEVCQSAYVQLQHISLWEKAICYLSIYDIPGSLECWRTLAAEANWSKCVYTYGLATCLLQIGGDDNLTEATKLMKKVPTLTQKIAGKSIPLEKFASRKARKFENQSDSLFLPALELSYNFLAIAHAPRYILVGKTLPDVEASLKTIQGHQSNPASYRNGHGFWDDYCLAHFLLGVVLRYIAYGDRDAVPEAREGDGVPDAEARAFAALQTVLDNVNHIELDHYLVYCAHYEIGRLHACKGNTDEAQKHYDLVLSGKTLVPKAGKGKYSMESSLMLRVHAAVETLRT